MVWSRDPKCAGHVLDRAYLCSSSGQGTRRYAFSAAMKKCHKICSFFIPSNFTLQEKNHPKLLKNNRHNNNKKKERKEKEKKE